MSNTQSPTNTSSACPPSMLHRVLLAHLFAAAQCVVLPGIGRVLSYPDGGHYKFAEHVGISGGHVGEVLKGKRFHTHHWTGKREGRPFYVHPVTPDADWEAGYLSLEAANALLHKNSPAYHQFTSLCQTGCPPIAIGVAALVAVDVPLVPAAMDMPVVPLREPLTMDCSELLGFNQPPAPPMMSSIMMESAPTQTTPAPVTTQTPIRFNTQAKPNVTVVLKTSQKRESSSMGCVPSTPSHPSTQPALNKTNAGMDVDTFQHISMHTLDKCSCDESSPSPFMTGGAETTRRLMRLSSHEEVDELCEQERGTLTRISSHERIEELCSPNKKQKTSKQGQFGEETTMLFTNNTLIRLPSGSSAA